MSIAAQYEAFRKAFRRAIVAAAITTLSSAPFDLPMLAFTFAPLLVLAIEGDTGGMPSLRRACFVGFAAGFFLHIFSFSWFGPMIVVHGQFPKASGLAALIPFAIAGVASIMLFATQALPYAFATLLAGIARRTGVPLTVALPPALAVAFALVPTMFPFSPSAPLVEFLPFVQIADLGGSVIVDLATAAVGCAMLEALRTRRSAVIALAIALFVGPVIYGSIRIDEVEAAREHAPTLRVGIVQPNISIAEKLTPSMRRHTLYVLRTLSHEAERRGADLIVWPETAYPVRIERGLERDPSRDRGIRRDGLTTPVIFGVVTGMESCDQANSVVGMSRDGRYTRPVDKVRLLPFVETFPGWESSSILTRIRPCFGYRAGPRAELIEVDGYRVGIMNCYEDLLGEHARELAERSPDFLLNVTNDAWFLDSLEPHQHHMVARLRAIETRRDLVRSVNTGVSGLISATGERIMQTETYTAVAPVVPVRMLSGTTFFARHGELALYVSIAMLLVSVLAARYVADRSAAKAE